MISTVVLPWAGRLTRSLNSTVALRPAHVTSNCRSVMMTKSHVRVPDNKLLGQATSAPGGVRQPVSDVNDPRQYGSARGGASCAEARGPQRRTAR